jgi:hypothetical protein
MRARLTHTNFDGEVFSTLSTCAEAGLSTKAQRDEKRKVENSRMLKSLFPLCLGVFVRIVALDNFASRNSLHQLAVCLEEVIVAELRAIRPFDGFEDEVVRLPVKGGNAKKNNLHVPVRVSVPEPVNFFPHVGINRQLLQELPAQRVLETLTLTNLAARKLPLQAILVRAVALADQDPLTIDYDAGRDQSGFPAAHKINPF